MAGEESTKPKSHKRRGAKQAVPAPDDDSLAPLTEPEQHLVACLKRGVPCVFDDEEPEKKRTLRAAVIERLMRGQALPGEGDALALPAKGLEIENAWVKGRLDLENCDRSTALALVGCELDEALVLRDARFAALYLSECQLAGIVGDRLRVDGDLRMHGSTCRRRVRFGGATVGGQLSLNGATLENVDDHGAAAGAALVLDGVRLGASAFFGSGFSAKGEVRMLGATVEGQVSFKGATLENVDRDGAATGNALFLDGTHIEGSVFLDDGFSAKGEVRMLGATVGSQLSFRSATLENVGRNGVAAGDALVLDGARIGGHAILDNGFSAKGTVRLHGATVEGDLIFTGAALDATGLERALSLQKATVRGGCLFRDLAAPVQGHVILTSAVLAEIIDDGSLWPPQGHGHIILDGMTYDRFLFSPVDWKSRRDWLRRQMPRHLGKDFAPQPWVQCAKVLREMGHDYDARRLLFWMHEDWRRGKDIRGHLRRHIAQPLGLHLRKWPLIRRSFRRPIWDWIWSQILRWTAGHGYLPGRAFLWIIGTVAIGTLIFSWAHAEGRMTPAKERFFLDLPRYQEYQLADVLPEAYPAFSPLVYSLDVFLPIVSFGQEDHWRPANLPFYQRLEERWWKPWTWNWYRVYNRLHIILGWFFTSIAILGFTGVIKRD